MMEEKKPKCLIRGLRAAL